MLNIYNFDVSKYGDGLSILSYYGENTGDMYHISKDGSAFTVDVETLDENGEAQEGPRYIFSSLSAAIAQIEEMESRE